MNLITQNLNKIIQEIKAENATKIEHNDLLFIERNFGDGLQKYIDRLQAIGFSGKQKVLDAGCGYGQWSLALAKINEAVESCDISNFRVHFLRTLIDKLGVKNLNTTVGGIDDMPYPDNYFDAVFCYGVIFLTPWRKSLTELMRVLKPEGKIYINANGLGWFIFLWQEEYNKADDFDPKVFAAKCLNDTLTYDRKGSFEPMMNIIIESQMMKKELEMLGAKQLEIGPEGSLHSDNLAPPPKPFFKGEYYGLEGIYELLATKKYS